MSKKAKARFQMSLKENGLHSLWRGIESYQEYEKSEDTWFLKEAVMFLHHGTELLMKEILVRHSEYLILEDLGENTVKKQMQATQDGVSIFSLDKPPRTITYRDAIDRVQAFVNPPELDEPLRTRLGELNQNRNQLEHYAVDANAETVAKLIDNLYPPLVALFEAQLGDVRQAEPAGVSKTVDEVQTLVRGYRLVEQEVCPLVQRFKGQEVPGRLFGISKELVLPDFSKGNVTLNYRSAVFEGANVDVLGESGEERWVIEVKARSGRRRLLWDLSQITVNRMVLEATTAWFILFGEVPSSLKQAATAHNVLITGASEWKELKQIIETGSV